MKFFPTSVHGVMLVESPGSNDSRGGFRRLWCTKEAEAAGVGGAIVQLSLSETNRRGTLRGMHFQLAPSREHKIVRCLRGRIFDVALDLRRNSPTYLMHFGTELAVENARALFIPAGCAHGFLTLEDNCAVLYSMTDIYRPALQGGVRWNDPAFGISWPEEPREMLDRDASYPDFDPRTVDGFSHY